jgi:cytochrome c oxidase assembly factor CtaG/polyferredoxin
MPETMGTAIARSWVIPFWPTCFLLLAAVVYLRGWLRARRTRPRELSVWRALCFWSGLLSLWLAIASPLDALGNLLLSAHMAQHFILMSVAPPLILLGAPTVPLLRGMPKALMRDLVAPWSSTGWMNRVGAFFANPVLGWISMNLAYVGWHIPAAYELTLRSSMWHEVEHGCFFFTSLLFWWSIIQPWPSHARFSRWLVVPYMLGAGVVNTALSSSFAFSGHIFYLTYTQVPRLFGISAMRDQVAAGVGMWVIGSIFLVFPAMLIVSNLLSTQRRKSKSFVILGQRPEPPPFDLLRMRGIGSLLRSRYGRLSLQAISLIVSALVIADGFVGHQMGAMNLAGIVPWNVVRVCGVLALLFAGNFFCMACPFMLPRELTRLLKTPRWKWPPAMRNKWAGFTLMLFFFWAYEKWTIWDMPRRTSAVLIGYFAAAFLIDAVFRGASFCKYVCPIGQFNFISSLISPLELATRSKSICASCTTHDCIRGNSHQRGCELDLYLPRKIGNVDCTLCMDCVKACPHDNIGITAANPIRDLLRDPSRASLGRLSARKDVATIALTIVFGSFATAAVMIAPGAESLRRLGAAHPLFASDIGTFACVGLSWLGLVAIVTVIAAAMHRLGQVADTTVRGIFCRFSLALLPLGLAMWAAHLVFHLGAGLPSIVPALQQAAGDFVSLHTPAALHIGSWRLRVLQHHYPLGEPHWATGSGIQAETLQQIQFVLLDGGLLISLYAGWKLAQQMTHAHGRPLRMWVPWSLAVLCLYAFGLWILTQPMEMRGMVMS